MSVYFWLFSFGIFVHIIADIIKFPTTVWIGKLVFIYISTLHYHVINIEQIIHIFREENKVLMGKTVSFWIRLKLIAVIFLLKCCCVHQMVATLFVLKIISVLFHNCNSVAHSSEIQGLRLIKMPRNAINLIKFYIKFGIQGCDCLLKIWYWLKILALFHFIGETRGKCPFKRSKQQYIWCLWHV